MAEPSQVTTLLKPGARLAHYIITRHLATGGMGDVYVAHEPDLGRDVAIKVLHLEHSRDPGVRESFRREAQTLAKLRHKNIMPVHYIGTEGELFFFVMPFIKGASLAERVQERHLLSPSEALWFMNQAVEALHAAFRQNIIHLDIKPENFLIDTDNTILLTDFGLARTLDDIFSTEGDIIFGTPYYVSPEQLDGSPADHRSDIYSLGATLFHLMAGTPLCEGKSLEEILQNHVSKKFPAHLLEMLDTPQPWIALIQRMTRLFPVDRFQAYDEIIVELKKLSDGSSGVATQPQQITGKTERSKEDTVTISIDARHALNNPIPPVIHDPNRPQLIRADDYSEARKIVLTHLGGLRAHSTIVLFSFPKNDFCTQAELEEGILSLMRNRDYAFAIRMRKANLGAILPNTPTDGAHIFLRRIMGQCLHQNKWAAQLHTVILDVNPETLETDLQQHLPLPPNDV